MKVREVLLFRVMDGEQLMTGSFQIVPGLDLAFKVAYKTNTGPQQRDIINKTTFLTWKKA